MVCGLVLALGTNANHVAAQGFAEFRSFPDATDNLVTVAVIARRSRLHAGTRYLARGLNPTYSTGQYIEDIIMSRRVAHCFTVTSCCGLKLQGILFEHCNNSFPLPFLSNVFWI